MQQLRLSKGYVAQVDDEDYVSLCGHKWTAMVVGKNTKRVYAYRRIGWDTATRRYTGVVMLHRAIIQAPTCFDVDHINGDALDNRRSNLRIATRSQNLANNRRAVGVTGYRGVSLTNRRELAPYKAMCRGKLLGTFFDKIEAARAYDAAAFKEFREFAKLNFPKATQSAS